MAVRSGIPALSQFKALSEEDRGYLIAYWRTKDLMAAYEQQLATEELAAAQAKRK